MALMLAAKTFLRSSSRPFSRATYSTATKQFNVVLDGQTLYVNQELAEALGWKPGTSLDGISLRLSGWEPNYFPITQPGTDADLLARGTIESSRNPRVQEVLEYLKKTDSE